MSKIKQNLCDVTYRAIRKLHLVKYVPDEIYLRLHYYCNFGKSLNLDNPQTYNEKCQWMKLNYHNPLFSKLADKYEVKEYVESILGSGYTFPLLGVWDRPEDVDFAKLPNEFILKCNHNSVFGMTICKDKEKGIYCKAHGKDNQIFGKEEAIAWMKRGFKEDYFYAGREWPYKNIKRKIIAEQLMKSDDGEPLKDYKFFCFDGEPKYVWVGSNYHPTWFNVMSADWKNQHVLWGYIAGPEILPPPNSATRDARHCAEAVEGDTARSCGLVSDWR